MNIVYFIIAGVAFAIGLYAIKTILVIIGNVIKTRERKRMQAMFNNEPVTKKCSECGEIKEGSHFFIHNNLPKDRCIECELSRAKTQK